jgi:GNAT superfamily N-acetyltransferase
VGTDPRLPSFFARFRELRAVVDAVVEGHLGHAVVDGEAARLSLGCYELFGGDPASPGARRLVASAARPRELVYGNDATWRRLILDLLGSEVSDRPMRDFDASRLDPVALSGFEASLPDGFTLRPIDAGLAHQLDSEMEPHGMQVFASLAELARTGLAFGAVWEDRLACAATPYTLSSRFVEVAIATRASFRGQGLAAAACAALMRRCLERGLTPRWSASNPVSQRLAVRLGFQPAGVCEVLLLRE